MEAGLWSSELRDWRKRMGLFQKEAANLFKTSEVTYRSWEIMTRTPPKFVRIALRAVMKNAEAAKSISEAT